MINLRELNSLDAVELRAERSAKSNE